MSDRVPRETDFDFRDASMLDLFRLEIEAQTSTLTDGLIALERAPSAAAHLRSLMRAAHSLKGAARMLSYDPVVRVSHVMEDCFVAAQREQLTLTPAHIDVLLQGVDLLRNLAAAPDVTIEGGGTEAEHTAAENFVATLTRATESSGASDASPTSTPMAVPASAPAPAQTPVPTPAPTQRHEVPAFAVPSAVSSTEAPAPVVPSVVSPPVSSPPPAQPSAGASAGISAGISAPAASASLNGAPVASFNPTLDVGPGASSGLDAGPATVRVGAEHLNRLLGLAGESLVASRWVSTFGVQLGRLKRAHGELVQLIGAVRDLSITGGDNERIPEMLMRAAACATESREALTHALSDLEEYDRRAMGVSHTLYQEVLASRMRPFADGVRALPRMVRDMARALGKQVRLEILGEHTPVDRDILQRLEAPLIHLLRNVVDHGIETVAERIEAGKPAEGHAVLQARHSAGKLLVTITDDGRGVSLDAIRSTVLRRQLVPTDVAEQLSDAELLEFLFLPGFSTRTEVTETSGRGVGLDAVRVTIREVGGSIDLSSEPGRGIRVHLHLPLTLSVVRTLVANIGGEPYAIPLTRVARVLKVAPGQIETVEGREHVMLDGQSLGLVPAHAVLGVTGPAVRGDDLSVVVLGDRGVRYGLVVDQFLGERELVVRPLDSRLGKVRDVSAAALLPDGAPVLIVDVDDLLRSVEMLVTDGRVTALGRPTNQRSVTRRHRVLVADDSITVRETERKLLEAAGYEVDVAVDGMDAWNAIRGGAYDLVVTDVDMPRLDGIELTTLIRKDARLRTTPVMIVSYKDRQEDRLRGLDAGADYYLTKASFRDDTLLQAAADLLGGATS